MDIKKTGTIVLALLCLLVSYAVSAEPTPRWVTKGVDELNKARSNDTYQFRIFHSYDPDEKVVELNRYKPLLDYVCSSYGVPRQDLNMEVLQTDEDGQSPVYVLSFMKNGKTSEVYAKLVDDFLKFDDYADGSFEHNLYQLYAISELNVIPRFDEFKLSEKYNGIPVALSVVPGLGQIYKGRKAKGYAIMGSEALLVTGVVVSAFSINKYERLAGEHPEFAPSYDSKAQSFRNFGTICAISGVGLYVYNLLDATFSKGVRYVKVKPGSASSGVELSFEPMLSYEAAGLGVKLKF